MVELFVPFGVSKAGFLSGLDSGQVILHVKGPVPGCVPLIIGRKIESSETTQNEPFHLVYHPGPVILVRFREFDHRLMRSAMR